jgi:hypothetical protein
MSYMAGIRAISRFQTEIIRTLGEWKSAGCGAKIGAGRGFWPCRSASSAREPGCLLASCRSRLDFHVHRLHNVRALDLFYNNI